MEEGEMGEGRIVIPVDKKEIQACKEHGFY
jgi:hypothetical protein